MKTEKKKRGRPPKHKAMEFEGMTYEGAINHALDKEVRADLDKCLADKDESQLTDDERKYLKRKKEKKSYTLNVRFTESEMQDILSKCEQYGYKNKTEYIRDCVRARVDLTPDRSEIAECNRLMKRIGANINQILVRLYSTGHIYAEDITEIKKGVNEIWHTLLSIRSGQQSAQRSLTSQEMIRPSTVYMSTLMLAEPIAQEQARTSEPSWKNWHESKKLAFQSLDLTKANGQKQDLSQETIGALLGEPWMLSIGEFPNIDCASRLSSILQACVPEKYYLSRKACEGILRRASRRGKQLPELLKTALEQQIERSL